MQQPDHSLDISLQTILQNARNVLEASYKNSTSSPDNLLKAVHDSNGFILFSLNKNSLLSEVQNNESIPIANGILILKHNNSWSYPVAVNVYQSSKLLKFIQNSNKDAMNFLLFFKDQQLLDSFIRNEEITLGKDIKFDDQIIIYHISESNGIESIDYLFDFDSIKIDNYKIVNQQNYGLDFNFSKIGSSDLKMKDRTENYDFIMSVMNEKIFKDTTGISSKISEIKEYADQTYKNVQETTKEQVNKTIQNITTKATQLGDSISSALHKDKNTDKDKDKDIITSEANNNNLIQQIRTNELSEQEPLKTSGIHNTTNESSTTDTISMKEKIEDKLTHAKDKIISTGQNLSNNIKEKLTTDSSSVEKEKNNPELVDVDLKYQIEQSQPLLQEEPLKPGPISNTTTVTIAPINDQVVVNDSTVPPSFGSKVQQTFTSAKNVLIETGHSLTETIKEKLGGNTLRKEIRDQDPVLQEEPLKLQSGLHNTTENPQESTTLGEKLVHAKDKIAENTHALTENIKSKLGSKPEETSISSEYIHQQQPVIQDQPLKTGPTSTDVSISSEKHPSGWKETVTETLHSAKDALVHGTQQLKEKFSHKNIDTTNNMESLPSDNVNQQSLMTTDTTNTSSNSSSVIGSAQQTLIGAKDKIIETGNHLAESIKNKFSTEEHGDNKTNNDTLSPDYIDHQLREDLRLRQPLSQQPLDASDNTLTSTSADNISNTNVSSTTHDMKDKILHNNNNNNNNNNTTVEIIKQPEPQLENDVNNELR